jgi:hypothetical protein
VAHRRHRSSTSSRVYDRESGESEKEHGKKVAGANTGPEGDGEESPNAPQILGKFVSGLPWASSLSHGTP